MPKQYQYDQVARDIEDAAVASEELGEMIRERLIAVFGVDKVVKWYRGEIFDRQLDNAYDKIRSVFLTRVYKRLAQAYADAETSGRAPVLEGDTR
jgi:hypothetical protein